MDDYKEEVNLSQSFSETQRYKDHHSIKEEISSDENCWSLQEADIKEGKTLKEFFSRKKNTKKRKGLKNLFFKRKELFMAYNRLFLKSKYVAGLE